MKKIYELEELMKFLSAQNNKYEILDKVLRIYNNPYKKEKYKKRKILNILRSEGFIEIVRDLEKEDKSYDDVSTSKEYRGYEDVPFVSYKLITMNNNRMRFISLLN